MTAMAFRFNICCILLTAALAFSPNHHHHHHRRYRCSSSFVLPSTKKEIPGLEHLEEIREQLSEHIAQWDSCVEVVAGATGMESEEAELRLAEATRWKAWAVVKSELARKYIKTVIPSVEEITESFTWLQSEPLLLNQEQLEVAVRDYAEIYLRTPAANFRKAKNVAPRKFRQNPDDFCQLVRNRPRALGLTYNCADDGCASECGSCWVTFENSS